MTRTKKFLQENRQRIQCDYQKRSKELPGVFDCIDKKMECCDEDTALACKYLYAYMPYSDIGNYPFEYFLDYAQNGVNLWREVPSVAELPEFIFLNFVLFHRVNEEEIAPCRIFFREKIGGRTEGLSIKEAALEVNYWCAEEATYQSSDDRTLSAISVYRRGNGRCGEESVLAVNALRSMGIPARQVYAPKWSHCDDNHAWVEIWSEGQWYFLGACEPEPILNKGWFTNASSRAMLIHSRVFDRQIPEGEVIGTEGMVTMMNELGRYARTKTLCVLVKDESGKMIENAKVSFEILNYSEYARIAEVLTDENGKVLFTTGLGSLHVWASIYREGVWLMAEAHLLIDEVDTCELCLKPFASVDGKWQPVDMVAPHDAPIHQNQPDGLQKEVGKKQFAEACAQREKKVRGWINPECQLFLQREGQSTDATTERFYREKLLEILTEKDRTDCTADVLEEHLQRALLNRGNCCDEIFVPYVLNPRVDNEVLQKYRIEIIQYFSEQEQQEFRKHPRKIWEAVEQKILSYPEKERISIITTPAGCLKTGTGSELSKNILFVAIARTLGIPARLDPIDQKMEYWEDGHFVPVLRKTEKQGTLFLHRENGQIWNYFLNWSMAKLEEGSYHSLRLGGKSFEHGKLEQKLEAGTYRILTSNRLPNGIIFANEYHFTLSPGEVREIELKLRPANLEDMLENLTLPEFALKRADDSSVMASDLTADGKHIFLFLEEEKEPTEHILNEIMEQKEAFEEIEERIIVVVRTRAALQTPTFERTIKNLKNIQIYYDDFSENIQVLGRRMYVDPDKLPLILVTNGRLNGIYAASGYNVGCGDLLLRLMR